MKEKNTGEIDFQDLLKRIIKGFVRNLGALITILTVSLGVAIILRYTMKETYRSQMIVRSDILTEPFTNNIAKSINDLIKTNSLNALQSMLSLTTQEASSLSEITIESLEEGKASRDQKEEYLAYFLVTAKVHDNEVLPTIQKGLIKYVENNDYVKVRVEQRKAYYERTLAKVEREIGALDSLKNRITSGQAFSSTGSSMVFFDPSNVYSRSIELFKEKIALEQSLQLANSIQLIEGFNIPNRPSSPGLSVFLPMGFGIGLALFAMYMALRGLIWISKQD